MSRAVSVYKLSQEERKKIDNELNIELEVSKYNKFADPETIQLFRLEDDTVFLPFSYSKKYKRPEASIFPKRNIEFSLELRPEQKTVCSEAISMFNKHSSCLISAHVGFGKTYCAIYIASIIKLPTIVLCHRCVLMKQWEESISTCSPNSSFQTITPKSKIKDVDIYIMNPTNISKFPKEFLKKIGTVIVDECHLVLAKNMNFSLLNLQPRFLLGLSGTPHRYDGLNVLFDFYFGNEKIERKLFRKHLVYVVKTGFVPETETAKNGKINWNSLIESISSNEERNETIIKLIKRFPDRTMLVLCKRISQAEFLVKRLQEEKESVTSLFGTKQEFDKESRILVGTTGKCSTGFDHSSLNTLLLCCDIEQYFIQALGRIFRTKEDANIVPLVIDMIDDHPVLKKHWVTRRNVYLEHGGTIKELK